MVVSTSGHSNSSRGHSYILITKTCQCLLSLTNVAFSVHEEAINSIASTESITQVFPPLLERYAVPKNQEVVHRKQCTPRRSSRRRSVTPSVSFLPSPSSSSQQDGKATDDAADEGQRAEGLTRTQSPDSHQSRGAGLVTTTVRATAAMAAAASATGGIPREARVDRLPTAIRRLGARTCAGAPTRGGTHGPGQGARVLPRGVQRTAGVILRASRLAGGVAVAVGDALLAPLGADVVGEGLGVFGDVGANSVVADARVGEGGGVAVVGDDGGRVGGGLEAD